MTIPTSKSSISISRKRWKNYVNDQSANPLRFSKPHSLSELRKILEDARSHGLKVKAIGSGHSSSDIAISRDWMIDTHRLNQVFNNAQLDLITPSDNLFFVECGIRIRDVNRELEKLGKALINMGAYDGQTIAGVISTSTHGSGITLGAFPDYLRSIFLLTEDGTLHQIERSPGKGISNGPARIQEAGMINFIQDDDYFFSAGVSMGCIGIIYAVVIEVTNKYMLEETRHFSRWTEVKKELHEGKILRDRRHYEVLVSPYFFNGNDHKCLVTERIISHQEYKSPLIPRGHRKILPELFVRIVPTFLIDAAIRFLINHFPKIIPSFVQTEINTLTDKGYIDKSYKVLNLGKDNNLAAYATEIALPEKRYLDAVEEIIRIVNQSVDEGRQYLTAPFSLRFVKCSPFYLSMQHGDAGEFVCMIEFPTVSKTIGGLELLARIEDALYRFGGIPHWGQINHVGGQGQSSVEKLYPRFHDWMRIYKKLAPDGRFENDFTHRCGISHFHDFK
jgi:FAD/FMN-containing dehydrogenase